VRTSACDLLDELGRQVGLLDLGRRELLVREDGRVWVQARAAFAVVCIAPGPQRSGGGRVRCACTEQSPLPCPPPPLRHPAARCRAHATPAHCFTSCSARTRVLSSWSEKKKTTSILRFPRAQQVRDVGYLLQRQGRVALCCVRCCCVRAWTPGARLLQRTPEPETRAERARRPPPRAAQTTRALLAFCTGHAGVP